MKAYSVGSGRLQSHYEHLKNFDTPLFHLLDRVYLEEIFTLLERAYLLSPNLTNIFAEYCPEFVMRIKERELVYVTDDTNADLFMDTCIQFFLGRFSEIDLLDIETYTQRSLLRTFEGNRAFESRARKLLKAKETQNEVCPFTQESVDRVLLYTYTDSRDFTWGFDLYSIADEIKTNSSLKNPLTREYLPIKEYLDLTSLIDDLICLGDSMNGDS